MWSVVKRSKAQTLAELEAEIRRQKCISKKRNNNKMLADQVVHAKQAIFFSQKAEMKPSA
jgi:hypothetical protein